MVEKIRLRRLRPDQEISHDYVEIDFVAGTYTNATVTVDEFGIVRAAANGVALDPEVIHTISASGSPGTFTIPGFGLFEITLTGVDQTVAFDVSGLAAERSGRAVLLLTQGGGGSNTIANGGWTIAGGGTVLWLGGAQPVLQTAAGAIDRVTVLFGRRSGGAVIASATYDGNVTP